MWGAIILELCGELMLMAGLRAANTSKRAHTTVDNDHLAPRPKTHLPPPARRRQSNCRLIESQMWVATYLKLGGTGQSVGVS